MATTDYEMLYDMNRLTIRADRKRVKFNHKATIIRTTSAGANYTTDANAAKITRYKGTPQSRAAKIKFSTEMARRDIKGHDEPTNRDNFEHFHGTNIEYLDIWMGHWH
jgi:hypothetical protein